MFIETFETSLSAQSLQLIFGLVLGLIFGAAAQASKFCLRRAVANDAGPDKSAMSVWVSALGAAVVAFALASILGLVATSDHRFQSPELPVAAIIFGGLLFGTGMILTRGCVSRLTVLSATGNLRAVMVLAVFALAAHATLKGVLAPVRTTIGSLSFDAPSGVLAHAPSASLSVGLALLIFGGLLARQSQTRLTHPALGALIGVVAVVGWMTTSILLMDEFDPLPVQSAAFTLPWSDTLFWFVASTSIPAGFGVGYIGGVLTGSFLSASLRGELALQSFETPRQTLRYSAGGALMGVGGVLAGGCTIGAGLSGGAMLSISALLALASVVSGALLMRRLLTPRPSAKVAI
ncbi:YeeE/YedE family protein [Ruegeria conchae]|uniref:YeeE/YedE family protein n=1 Tax=Ruegeria conchae TaxID=981384 RepID=UPI0029C9363C|nr:YeeE/YedE family protein [Ruegeria conchae]